MVDLNALQQANAKRWASAKLTRGPEFTKSAKTAIENKGRYLAIARQAGMPDIASVFIAVSHYFNDSLAQGIRGTRCQIHVPAGRGPFTSFEAAAVDALVKCSSNVIDLSAARAAATATALAEMIPASEPSRLDTEEELDRQSQIMRSAVTYTALNGSFNGAWIAEHTGNSTVAEIVNDGVWERRNAMLRKLTRLMRKAEKVRTVELWSIASTAKVVMNQNGDGESGRNLADFEILFLQSLFELIERDCDHREETARRESKA